MTINGGGSYKQSIYYPFLHASKYGRGKVLQTLTQCGKYDSKDFTDVPILDAVAVENEEHSELTIFAVNKDLNDDILTSFNTQGYEGYELIEHIVMQNNDIKAINTIDKPDVVVPVTKPTNGAREALLPKLSWNVLRFKTKISS